MVWPALIAAGASLAGGLLSRGESSANRETQKEFAQQGIRWKVADAKAAGIHPLYALGAQTHSFQPTMSGLPDAVASAGQDVARAVQATRTEGERVTAYETSLRALTLQKFGLENELLGAQIAKLRQVGPPMPSAVDPYLMKGQAQSGLIVEKPMERTSSGSKAFQEPGALPDVGWARTPTGLAPVPSNDVKQRIEDQVIPELQWSIRNNLIPSISREGARLREPPKSALPKGAYAWYYNVLAQEYQPVYGPSPSGDYQRPRNQRGRR